MTANEKRKTEQGLHGDDYELPAQRPVAAAIDVLGRLLVPSYRKLVAP